MRSRPAGAFALALAAVGCDGGLQPQAAPTSCPRDFVGICGTVRFQGTVPDSTDNVFIVAYQAFPQTCDDLYDLRPIPPPPVPYTDSTALYTLPLANGTYEWVLAVWKKQGTLTLTVQDTALLRWIGHYRDPADTAQPGPVLVSGTGTDSVDFTANFDDLRPVSNFFTCTGAR